MALNIRKIIVLMSLALLGLVAFQWYWISSAISVRREQFDQKVSDALQATIKKIEKQEVIYLTKQKMLAQEQQKLVAIARKKPKKIAERDVQIAEMKNAENMDKIAQYFSVWEAPVTTHDALVQEFYTIPDRQINFIREVLEENNLIWEELSQPSREMLLRQKNMDDLQKIVNTQLLGMQFNLQVDTSKVKQKLAWRDRNVFNHQKKQSFANGFFVDSMGNHAFYVLHETQTPTKPRRVENPQQTMEDRYQQAAENKANIVKDVFKDFITGKRNIYERLNRQTLDTLLRQEFKNRGISIPFDYGVQDGSHIIFSSFNVENSPKIFENAFKTPLFPNDALPNNQFLSVSFPEKDNFILRNMWLVFVSSGLLILMVGGVFYASVDTILKQKKLSDIKNDFINNMTHEFKTPISTISLATQVLKDDSVKKDLPKMNRYLNVIQDENKRLGTQVEKVLQMALLDKGEVKLKLHTVNIHEVIEQVLQNLSVQIEQKNGIVNLELDAENPEIEADQVHLTNIIYNLLDNANKYSPENPEITIQTENKDNALIIKVLDKGIGMTKEQMAKVFDKFYRVPTGNLHDVKGFGLGLSYVKKMVDSHGGEIRVASKIGEGSLFEIVLPLTSLKG